MKTERTHLASKKHHRKQIDMEWVYKELDEGRTIKSVAEELQISVSTLRRRHSEYQQRIKIEHAKEVGYFEGYENQDHTFEF